MDSIDPLSNELNYKIRFSQFTMKTQKQNLVGPDGLLTLPHGPRFGLRLASFLARIFLSFFSWILAYLAYNV